MNADSANHFTELMRLLNWMQIHGHVNAAAALESELLRAMSPALRFAVRMS